MDCKMRRPNTTITFTTDGNNRKKNSYGNVLGEMKIF